MDPPAVMSAPSLKLRMVSSFDDHFPSHSPRSNVRGGIIYGVEAQSSRDLLYDQLYKMIAQEERAGYRCCDYLSFYSPQQEKRKSPKSIDANCRSSICKWMYRVADHYAIDREVVSIALSYIDRVLSTNYCTDRRTFKLISASSLHLAIKVHYPHRWREVGSIIPDLSRGDFGLDDLISMEKELTHSLTWLVNPSTPQGIILQVLSLLHPGASTSSLNAIADKAIFFAELSVCDYFFVTSRKSVVALAALLNASESAGYVPFETSDGYRNDWHTDIENLLLDTGYDIDWMEVSSTRKRLWTLYRESIEPASGLDITRSPIPSRMPVYGSSTKWTSNPSPTSCIDQEMQHIIEGCCPYS
ncbi:hypothetical protein ACHAW5_009616 [Stephanodiscus triporus]|uniref:Cyclin-like domain-containing protein n=1 Tax=Stephanodiscus triporus TaxID=2934178 RepID=A0ABD3NS17_9STRA